MISLKCNTIIFAIFSDLSEATHKKLVSS